jgi:hypothetical protein
VNFRLSISAVQSNAPALPRSAVLSVAQSTPEPRERTQGLPLPAKGPSHSPSPIPAANCRFKTCARPETLFLNPSVRRNMLSFELSDFFGMRQRSAHFVDAIDEIMTYDFIDIK